MNLDEMAEWAARSPDRFSQTRGLDDAAALYVAVRLQGPPGSVDRGLDPPIDSGPHSGPASPSLSPVVRREVRHAFGCALPCRGGVCSCGAVEPAAATAVRTPDLRTSSRGITYDLAQLLGDGYYEAS